MKRQYSITTKVVREGDQYAVYDEIAYEDEDAPTLVCRLRGKKAECEEYGRRLAEYWKQKLTETPPV